MKSSDARVFWFKGRHSLVRLGVLTGFLGYVFAVLYLLVDLGRPWHIYYPRAEPGCEQH